MSIDIVSQCPANISGGCSTPPYGLIPACWLRPRPGTPDLLCHLALSSFGPSPFARLPTLPTIACGGQGHHLQGVPMIAGIPALKEVY